MTRATLHLLRLQYRWTLSEGLRIWPRRAEVYVYLVQQLRHDLKLLPLQGATAPTRDTQGVASLALGYVLHWAFSPPLFNQELE
jgi:hypothetical protein